MLAVTDGDHSVEHSVFSSRSNSEWTDLARERASHPRCAIFVAHEVNKIEIAGLLWAFLSNNRECVDLTWHWVSATTDRSATMAALVAEVHQWAAGHGRRRVRHATGTTREKMLFEGLGFDDVGVARDGVRSVFDTRA